MTESERIRLMRLRSQTNEFLRAKLRDEYQAEKRKREKKGKA